MGSSNGARAIIRSGTLGIQQLYGARLGIEPYFGLYSMIASTQITNNEVFTFIPVIVFELLRRRVYLYIEKTIKTVKK